MYVSHELRLLKKKLIIIYPLNKCFAKIRSSDFNCLLVTFR